ncbi:MAG: aldose epimerase family protein [Clostridia bacterium]
MLKIYTLKNKSGMTVCLTNAAAAIQSIMVPGRDGSFIDVVLGYNDAQSYFSKGAYHGAVIGRVANRIEDARFTLNGREYITAKNMDNRHTLHGGTVGLDSKTYTASVTADSVAFSTTLPDGEDGFPGNVAITVTYSLTDDNRLSIHYEAESDADTPINLTNHAYFNLAGAGSILPQRLMINSDFYYPLGANGMVMGEHAPVRGTMDFRTPKAIGRDIESDCEQLKIAGGYDHNFELAVKGNSLSLAAQAWDDDSGRTMRVFTNMPGVLFYSGNALASHPVHGKGNRAYRAREGFCLETNFCPNALRFPNLPQPILRVGEKYDYTTVLEFATC